MSGSSDKPGQSMNPATGYGKPPRSTRFQKGQSGNPAGRPKGRHRQAPHEAVLGQKVSIREQGQARQVTAAEAFLKQLTKRGLEGNAPATRDLLVALQKLKRENDDPGFVSEIVRIAVAPGSVNCALEPLRMARKLAPYRETARMMIEPWLVKTALARFGARRLTSDEQKIVVTNTRTPHKVRWPDWWTVKPWENKED